MDILNYNRWLDHTVLKEFLRIREMDESLANDLPEIGFIAVVGAAPIAAGFLRKIEGKTAQIDSLISFPLAPPELRNLAIEAIVEKLIEYAKDDGVESIIAFSTDAHTLIRAKKHGFKLLPHTVMALDLRGKK